MHLAHVFTPHCGSRCLSARFIPSTCHPWCYVFERALLIWTSQTPRPRSLLRTPMNMTSTTFGTLCWNFHVTRISAFPWKRCSTKKIWCGSHFLVISHWTSFATKNELASEEKTYTLLMPQTSQARLGMTKRASEDSITLDSYDPRSLEIVRQLGAGLFGHARNSL